MKERKFPLSKREEELMEMLWALDRPMTSTDMVAEKWERSWKDNYLKIMLRSLLDKGALVVCGAERRANIYLRLFVPAFTKEEYAAKIAASRIEDDQVVKVMAALVKETNNTNDDDLINRLDRMIQELREE